MTAKNRRAFVALVASFTASATAACGSGPPNGEWAGAERDSAGIVIIDNAATGVWEGGGGWEVEEELRIGSLDGDAEYAFGNVVGIEVGSDGSIYVLDQQAQEVRSYDAEGAFLERLGRPGSGPGELTQGASALVLGRGDTLLVADPGAQRMNRYVPSVGEAGSFPLPVTEGIAVKWALTPERELVQQAMFLALPGQGQEAPVSTPANQLLLRDLDGSVRDTIMELTPSDNFEMGDSGPRMRIFGAESVWGLTEDGRIVSGMSDDYRIEVRGLDGELQRVFTKPFEPRPISESDQRVYLEALETMLEAQGVPQQAMEVLRSGISFAASYPAFINMLGGPNGSIWIQHVQTPDNVQEAGGVFDLQQDVGGPDWDVFDADGRYQGVLRLPTRFNLIRIVGDQLYGVWRDDLDVQHVLRLRLVRSPDAIG